MAREKFGNTWWGNGPDEGDEKAGPGLNPQRKHRNRSANKRLVQAVD